MGSAETVADIVAELRFASSVTSRQTAERIELAHARELQSEKARADAAEADARRLTALEALLDAMPDGMLLLHHGQGNGRGLSGLGMRNTGRSLRQAIDHATGATHD